MQLVPQDRLSVECLKFVCRLAGLIYDRGFQCDCDPTGSVSGICKAEGGQCECKPNVVGRRWDRTCLFWRMNFTILKIWCLMIFEF